MSMSLKFQAYFTLLFVENTGIHWFVNADVTVHFTKKKLL